MPREDISFKLVSKFQPQGSQPEAIKQLVSGLKMGHNCQTLLGVTGSGKTFTMANVIQAVQKPTIVLAHNKTLAAQLWSEFREFFPENRVEYFVSYYDYYQPESYMPGKDQYIEKDAHVNPKLEQMRLAATASLLSRKDTIVVASVSCIYSLGAPSTYHEMSFEIATGQEISRRELMGKLLDIRFERNDFELLPGRFRVKGDTIDLIPAYAENIIRVELFGDEIEKIRELDRNTREVLEDFDYFFVFPASHYVVPEDEIEAALKKVEVDLEKRLPQLGLIESHRLKKRTLFDMEMIRETGFCKGIENYSRYFDGRKEGERPYCLLDYFPKGDFLFIIDESHQTIPQLHAMYKGDYRRKENLVDFGFRLPSAFENRPLKFHETESEFLLQNQTIFTSATPGDYELKLSAQVVEQVIRPTGLVDPVVEIRPIKGQIQDLKKEIATTIQRGDRILVTTLTKRLAEELTAFLAEQDIRTRYLHSEVDTLERTEIIRQLRLGKFDVLVGINLLREGLDIPEVGFIGILDADKEGFLRDTRSLIQTIGRAARNVNAKVVLYADRVTKSIKAAMEETRRRRQLQLDFNEKHGITPMTIIKAVPEPKVEIKDTKHIPKSDIPALLVETEVEMRAAADRLDFERAIALRDRMKALEERLKGDGGPGS